MAYQVKVVHSIFSFFLDSICLRLNSGLGITGGVHRLWAHRSYKASFPLRVALMLFNSIANQGSIYHWARDHRVHHKHSEVQSILHYFIHESYFSSLF